MNTVTACVAGVLGIVAIGVGGMVALEIFRPGGDWNSNVTTNIISVCTTVLTVLLSILKSQANGNAIEQVKQHAQIAAIAAAQAAETPKVLQADVTVHSDNTNPSASTNEG